MKKIILDTNAYAGFLAGDKNVLASLGKAETVYMSVFVLGEIYAGIKGGTKEQKNKNILEKFLDKSTVLILDATSETSEIFGHIKHQLRRNGTPLPINDVWIAAHTMETGSVIISYDIHFLKVPGIRVWDKLQQQV